ncbi:three prime repair exonuclease 2 [Trichonephila clavipes]|nr:three prime repair exonuclease 2 [Trichonephila clavipes]
MIHSEFAVAMDDSVLHFIPSSNSSILTRGIIKSRSLSDLSKVLSTSPSKNLSINNANYAFGGTILNAIPVLNPVSSVTVPFVQGVISQTKIYQDACEASNLLKHSTANHYTNAIRCPNLNNMCIGTHANSPHILTNPQELAINSPQTHASFHSTKLLDNSLQAAKFSATPNVSMSKTDSPQKIDLVSFKSQAQATPPQLTISSLVFFDLETTGLAYEIGKSNVQITEVSMVAISRKELEQSKYEDLRDIRIIQKLCICIRPRSSISPTASEITGLNSDNLVDQQLFEPKAAELINSFLSHLPKPVCLLAHNGECFDFPLLKAEFTRLSASLSSDIFVADTLKVFRTFGVPVFPPEKKISPLVKYTKSGKISCALSNLHLYFFNKHPPGSHSSEGDCIALAKKKIESGEELSPKRKKKCGRKPIFTSRSERSLKKICLENRFATTKVIKSQLQDINANASERTVRRKLKDLNFKTCRPARKPKLTPAMKAKPLHWAKQWRDKDVDFWRLIELPDIQLGLSKLFLAEQNIALLDWPGNSPDMNLIENFWELMKREVPKDVITNKTLLLERIIHVWVHHPQMQETVKSSIDSMPCRIEALIAAKGGSTKY